MLFILVAAFDQEKALVGAFSMITNLRMDLRFKLYSLGLWWAEVTHSVSSARSPAPPVMSRLHVFTWSLYAVKKNTCPSSVTLDTCSCGAVTTRRAAACPGRGGAVMLVRVWVAGRSLTSSPRVTTAASSSSRRDGDQAASITALTHSSQVSPSPLTTHPIVAIVVYCSAFTGGESEELFLPEEDCLMFTRG